MMVGRLLSYWEGNFSGAMLIFGRVIVAVRLHPMVVNRPALRRLVGAIPQLIAMYWVPPWSDAVMEEAPGWWGKPWGDTGGVFSHDPRNPAKWKLSLKIGVKIWVQTGDY